MTEELTAREREIVIGAICNDPNPEYRAVKIKHGLAALKGNHAPSVIWPNEFSFADRAAWLEAEAAYCRSAIAEPSAAEGEDPTVSQPTD